MTRRIRSLGGSLALLALALSFGEAVLASVCAPGADMAAMPGMTEMSGPTSDDESMAAMLGMADADTGRDAGEGTFDCPLATALGPGCSSFASLPAGSAAGVWHSAPGLPSTPFEDVGVDALLTHALFRPPRA